MALTITSVNTGVIGDLRYRTVDVAFDTSYDSGGEPLTSATLGLDSIYYLRAKSNAGYLIKYDYTNFTLRVYLVNIAATADGDIVATADNSIVANATNTGIEVSGIGTAFQVVLGEVTATTDLSTALSSVRLFILGR